MSGLFSKPSAWSCRSAALTDVSLLRCRFGAVLLALLCLNTGATAGDNTVILQDDFTSRSTQMPDGSTRPYPDRSIWAFTFWPGSVWPDSYGDGTNWLEGNGESQVYLTPFTGTVHGTAVPLPLRYDPFTLRDDGLHITASVLSDAQQQAYRVGGHRRFGSGMLRSRQTFTYGHIRMIARLPSARGSWPAFWLLPKARIWPPEIDIFEGMTWGTHRTGLHVGILTPKEENQTFGEWIDVGVDPSKDFHEYGLDWTPETLTITFDGKPIARRPTPPSMKQPMYLLINLAVGGKWPCNELGIRPIDSLDPERLNRCADEISADYPAEMIVRSVSVTTD